jgi:hypothetical protein
MRHAEHGGEADATSTTIPESDQPDPMGRSPARAAPHKIRTQLLDMQV